MKKKKILIQINSTFVLLTILFGILFFILYLYFRINSYEQKREVQFVNLPPNGTVLFQPSATPSPKPRNISSGTYSNTELGISMIIPEIVIAIETVEPDGWLKLRITEKTGERNSMIITRRKSVFGYGGSDPYDCSTVVSGGKVIRISNKEVIRCELREANKKIYDVKIDYPDEENPLSIGVYYDFEKQPGVQDFELFDSILSTLKFI